MTSQQFQQHVERVLLELEVRVPVVQMLRQVPMDMIASAVHNDLPAGADDQQIERALLAVLGRYKNVVVPLPDVTIV